jgi:hypothetical protein
LAALTATIALTALGGSSARASNCNGTSTGLVPLIDLGAGLYQGFPGGLYGNGSNARPAGHDAAGIAIASALGLLDTLGVPNPGGRIVLISIGMSNATLEFSTFVPIANADPAKSARVQVIDCAEGGQATQDIRLSTAPYWEFVASRLRANGSSPLQAQVVWLKEARRNPTEPFPASAESLTNDLGRIVNLIHAKLPNVKLLYFTSRIYAGYASSTLNPEPYAYESGFAVKWLIDAQIAGVDSLEYDGTRGPVMASWLSWGPYLWADGLTPRSDGLTWSCGEFQSDGTHPATGAREKVADSLLAFFHHDATTRPWFLKQTASVPAPGSGVALAVRPNPARDVIEARFTVTAGRAWRLELLDASGRRLRELAHGVGAGMEQVARWRVPRATAAGIYWLRLRDDQESLTRRIAVVP